MKRAEDRTGLLDLDLEDRAELVLTQVKMDLDLGPVSGTDILDRCLEQTTGWCRDGCMSTGVDLLGPMINCCDYQALSEVVIDRMQDLLGEDA